MKIMVLASGSKGNCTYIETYNNKILIDLGISYKKLKTSLEEINVCPKDITDIFLTHEHYDHTSGLAVFFRFADSLANLHTTLGTMTQMLANGSENLIKTLNYLIMDDRLKIIRAATFLYEDIFLKDLNVKVVPTFHDAKEPVGFIFNYYNKRLVYLTDTGYIHSNLFPLLKDATCYIIETNHDIPMLMESSRPFHLKQRILSQDGHLSNEDSLVALAKLIGQNTRYVLHAHISSDCNTASHIKLTRKKIFEDLKVICHDVSFDEIIQDKTSKCIIL